MEDPFANPYWSALITEQAAIALGSGPARRYPADVIPFAGVRDGGQGVSTNARAIRLYERLGFTAIRTILFHQVRRRSTH